jgi:hypothetical protein
MHVDHLDLAQRGKVAAVRMERRQIVALVFPSIYESIYFQVSLFL